MKKTIVLLLTLALLFSLSGCKSKEAKQTDAYITAIGEVTLESENAIILAEASYEALSAEDKETVEGIDTLRTARQSYDDLAAADKVDGLIAALGEADYSLAASLKEAREAYNALSEGAKALLTGEEKLLQTEKKMDELLCLVGAWLIKPDITDMMNEAVFDAFGGEEIASLGEDAKFLIPFLFSFDEEGEFSLSLDSEEFGKELAAYGKVLVDWLVNYTYEEMAAQGLSAEQTEQYFKDSTGMSLLEYYDSFMGEYLKSLGESFQMTFNGNYSIEGDTLTLSFPAKLGGDSRFTFTRQGEKLTLLDHGVNIEDEYGIFSFPMELTLRK